jgi:RNA polymerase sigma factor (sigma-70 family)
VGAVREGDDHAFEQLYARYQRRIAAYVYGMVHDHGRAEDITQDVFVSALRRIRATNAPIAFKPWIYEIAKNACIDAFRRSRRAEEISYDADDGSERLRLVSPGPTPDAAVDTRMSLDHLRGAFGGLSDAHHQILVMRELEGLSYREIGERLGMSRPSVESTLFRARRRLTEEYEELVSGERCRRIQSIIAGASGGHVGSRDERRMGRHVSYCQPCRRAAVAAGFDLAALAPAKTLRGKIAALLPLPGFLKRRLAGSVDDGGSGGTLGGQGAAVAQWSAAAAHYAEPSMSGWAKAAAVAATVAVAGVGAGVATHESRLGLGSGEAAAERTAPARPVADHETRRAARAVAPASGAQRQSSVRRRSSQASGSSGSGGGRNTTASQPSGAAPTSSSTAPTQQAPAGSDDDPVKQVTRRLTSSTQTSNPTGRTGSQPLPKVQLKAPTVELPPPLPEPSSAVQDVTDTVNDTAGGATDTVNGLTGGLLPPGG